MNRNSARTPARLQRQLPKQLWLSRDYSESPSACGRFCTSRRARKFRRASADRSSNLPITRVAPPGRAFSAGGQRQQAAKTSRFAVQPVERYPASRAAGPGVRPVALKFLRAVFAVAGVKHPLLVAHFLLAGRLRFDSASGRTETSPTLVKPSVTVTGLLFAGI